MNTRTCLHNIKQAILLILTLLDAYRWVFFLQLRELAGVRFLWSTMPEFSETLDTGLENQDLGGQDQVLVSVSTQFSIQDMSRYQTGLVVLEN